MKRSTYLIAFLIVTLLFATLFYVATLLNNGNAGLHLN
jgi:uncharacterized membrane protein YhaH (DUF805 family)